MDRTENEEGKKEGREDSLSFMERKASYDTNIGKRRRGNS